MRRFLRLRAIVVASLLAGLLAAVPAVPATAASNGAGNSDPNNYLALGDSVPFGYSPIIGLTYPPQPPPPAPNIDPDQYLGYPQLASDLFRPRRRLFNASCPGETSTSMITGTLPDNGCQNYRTNYGPLHVAYSGSQLAYADSYVAANPRTELVTISIGANDLLLLIDSCGGISNLYCIYVGLPTVIATLESNLAFIYSSLRAHGFRGEFVAVTYYSTNYHEAAPSKLIRSIDTALTNVTTSPAFGGRVADGFTVFGVAATPYGLDPCAAGLLVRLTATTSDVNPSPAGAALLAQAVRAVA